MARRKRMSKRRPNALPPGYRHDIDLFHRPLAEVVRWRGLRRLLPRVLCKWDKKIEASVYRLGFASHAGRDRARVLNAALGRKVVGEDTSHAVSYAAWEEHRGQAEAFMATVTPEPPPAIPPAVVARISAIAMAS